MVDIAQCVFRLLTFSDLSHIKSTRSTISFMILKKHCKVADDEIEATNLFDTLRLHIGGRSATVVVLMKEGSCFNWIIREV